MTKHRITERMRAIVGDLRAMEEIVRRRLDAASPEARSEWGKLCARIPTCQELELETLALSEAELEQMKSKTCRFAEILRGLGNDALERTGNGAGPGVDRPS